MANVNIQLGHKDSAWFTANPTKILLDGQIVYLEQTGTYKLGDGITELYKLDFLGTAPATPNLADVLLVGNSTGNTNILVETANAIELKNGSLLKEGTYEFGGGKGISKICSVGYEDNWQSGIRHVFDNSGNIRESSNCFNIIPDNTFDGTLRFKVGSRWVLDNGDVYVCSDASTGTAVWSLIPSQVNADWNATSGVAEILNKPSIPAAQIQSDWNQTNNASLDYIKNKPTVGTGDMLKSTYDTDNTGIVDNAEAIKIIGRNSTGVTLYRGTVVYLNGATGNRPNFAKAKADAESTSAGTFGVIVDDIANNADGYCIALGYLDNLDTRTTATNPFTSDTLAAGDTIYLSPTTAGYITNVKPYAPNHLVYLGKVTRTSPTNGTIVYRVQNGYELDELHNVQAQSPTLKDTLYFDNTVSPAQWKTASISTILGYTPVTNARTITINGVTYDLTADRTWTISTTANTSINLFNYYNFI